MKLESLARAKKFKIGVVYKGTGEVNGIYFELLKRKKDVCLFKRSDNHYEVIDIRQQKASTQVIGGNTVEFKEKESYPSGESWDGSCVSTIDRAIEIYNIKTKNR